MEVASRIGDKAASQERAAQIRRSAASLLDELLVDSHLQAAVGQHAQIAQRSLKLRLRRNRNQEVRSLVQHAAADRKLGAKRVDLMERTNDQARHRTDLSGDFQSITTGTRKEQRALDAHERSKGCLVAMAATGHYARKFVFNFRSERHGF